MNSSTDNMLSLILELIRRELDKRDKVVVCQITEVNKDNYDLIVVPDVDNVIHNIYSISNYKLNKDDYVYLYKINNDFQNAFIIGRIGGYKGTTQ